MGTTTSNTETLEAIDAPAAGQSSSVDNKPASSTGQHYGRSDQLRRRLLRPHRNSYRLKCTILC